MKKITIPVSGMYCTSCEILLEKAIKKVPNVAKVEAFEKEWRVEIGYEGVKPNTDQIESIIEQNGYSIWTAKKLPWISADIEDYSNALIAGVIIFILYVLASSSGWSFGSVWSASSPTLGVAFLIGLTAGVSSCMALIGWLVLGISAKWNKEHASSSTFTRFSPHIYFHLGRILGFGLLGGVLWFFGSIIHFSSLFLGVTTALVGIVMLLLGLNLTNLSPRLGSFSLKLPKVFGKNVNGEGTSKTSILSTWAATFFLPCGFTLAMQAYAVSTGSFVTGALALMLFALGTVPGLLSIGFVSAVLKGEWLKKFFTFTWVIVLVLWFFNFSNGYALISLGAPATTTTQNVDTTSLEIQEVRMTQGDSWYAPTTLSINAGKKIRWIITSNNPYSCSSQIIVPSLGISKSLQPGENVIEFVAPKSGEIPFSCSMGMYRGKFVVNSDGKNTSVNNGNNPAIVQTQAAPVRGGGCSMMGGNGGWCGGMSGGGCSMMGGNRSTTQPSTNTTAISQPPDTTNLEVQEIRMAQDIAQTIFP